MKARFCRCSKGFTLVELVIVMAIFMIILMISASAFENAFNICTGITKSAQSEIEGVVGLELLRKDLNAAGYGLPWSFMTPPDSHAYLEADLGLNNPVIGLSADDFNDAPGVPRAVILGTVPISQSTIYETKDLATGKMDSNPGSDYLVIKSTVVAINDSVGKWGFINYSGDQTSNKSYITKLNTGEDLNANDVVITHTNTFSGSNQALHVLAMKDASNYSYKLSAKDTAGHFVPPDTNYMPTGDLVDPFGVKINNEKMIAYAIRSFPLGSSDTIRMPFNRADYFVRRPTTVNSMPARCNPGTGILYKAVIINSMSSGSGGGRNLLYPLLDCVGDMQVVFYMQDPTDASKTITTDTLETLTAEDIRTRLKAIRVYLLVQEGGKDMSYSYPFSDPNKVITVADDHTTSLGRVFSRADMIKYFGPEWNRYRWKVYSVTGQPYNLMY